MRKILPVLILISFLTSCFKEDIPVKPRGGEQISVTESIYTHESFFDLATGMIVSVNPIDKWDLGFESSKTGWHIIINSGKYLGVYASGSTDFDNLTTVPPDAIWKFDKSDGNLDSTAIGSWLSPPSSSTNEVFVIGINDGIKYIPFKKIVFTSLISDIYNFKFANIDGTELVSFSVSKDPAANFSYFNFSAGGKVVAVEPPLYNWDFVFTQYSTILYTDLGIATPYFVRGVLINQNGVEVALDTLTGFANLTSSDLSKLKFSAAADAIGYDWKSVVIVGTTATYAIRPKNTYIVKSTGGIYYKMRFTGFFNDLGSPGYPRFEFKELL
jgi:hypothetical protein